MRGDIRGLPDGENRNDGLTDDYLREVRFRAERRDHLCLYEHVIHRTEDGREVWVECGGIELGPGGRLVLDATSRDQSDAIRAFIAHVTEYHYRAVASDLIVKLLDRLELQTDGGER